MINIRQLDLTTHHKEFNDKLQKMLKSGYYYSSTNHLICYPYSIQGLHDMARVLNIAENYFVEGQFPHYKIPRMRLDEIQAQCIKKLKTSEMITIIKSVN